MIIKRIILILIGFLIISIFLFNYQNYQKIHFYNEKFLKENNSFNKEIFLLKEVATNLEKFRLFFEDIYLEEIKRLIRESKILKDNIIDSFVNNLTYLTLSSKIKKEDLIVFTNFRKWLKEKEEILRKELTKIEIEYQAFKEQKMKELNLINIIGFVGLFVLVILANIFLPFDKRKEKIFNNYFSLLEALKIVKEKIDKYLEKVNFWESRLKESQKILMEAKNLENIETLNNYKKFLTYSLLNLQLGFFQNDQSLINKYFTNFKEMSEKIINLLSPNEKEKLIIYFKESEEEFNLFKEELINFKKMIGEIKNYEIEK